MYVDPALVEAEHLDVVVHQLDCDREEELLALGLVYVAVADARDETQEVQADRVFRWQRETIVSHSGHNSVVGDLLLLL